MGCKAFASYVADSDLISVTTWSFIHYQLTLQALSTIGVAQVIPDPIETMEVKKGWITVTKAVNIKLRQYYFSKEGEVIRVNEEVD